jgi:hypothetical protein
MTFLASSMSSEGSGCSDARFCVVPVVGHLEPISAGVANQPYEPIVLPIDPCADYPEAGLLSQRHDAGLPSRDPRIHLSVSDPVVAQLNLHDVEDPR